MQIILLQHCLNKWQQSNPFSHQIFDVCKPTEACIFGFLLLLISKKNRSTVVKKNSQYITKASKHILCEYLNASCPLQHNKNKILIIH